MANFSAKILNNSVGALTAQQAVIASISNNIANVNTPGYSRRNLELETAPSTKEAGKAAVGNGVRVGDVLRESDKFLEKILRDANGDKSFGETNLEFINRFANLFSLTGDYDTIGSSYSAFYNAANDLTTNPASIELRTNFISAANELVATINTTYSTLGNLQSEADRRLSGEVEQVNGFLAEIADLNSKIVTRESSGALAADERDRRDVALQKLSEKISYSITEVTDGSVSISVGNGFVLVSGGTSRTLGLTEQPSFAPGVLPPALDGSVLRYIVYNYGTDVNPAEIDLTQSFKNGSGSIGALLNIRGYNDPANVSAFSADGPLVEAARKVEALTRQLLTTVNLSYLGPDETPGGAFQPSALDLDGNTPSVYGLFDFEFAGAKDNSLPIPNGLPDDVGNHGIDNYSSLLRLTISSPREVAAALDSDPANGALALAPGDGRNLENLISLLGGSFSFSASSFSQSSTIDELYSNMVSTASSVQSRAQTDMKVATSNFLVASNRRDEVSAVSLDEEFSNLIRFQRAYQASARMIRVADELLEQIVGLI